MNKRKVGLMLSCAAVAVGVGFFVGRGQAKVVTERVEVPVEKIVKVVETQKVLVNPGSPTEPETTKSQAVITKSKLDVTPEELADITRIAKKLGRELPSQDWVEHVYRPRKRVQSVSL